MGYFKLDKIDKIVISFTFIIVTIFCLFNTFCFAVENIDISIVNRLGINNQTNTFVQSNTVVGYVELEKGYEYIISIPSNFSTYRTVMTSNSVPDVGVSYNKLGIVNPGDTFTYRSYYSDSYLYLDLVSANEGVTISKKKLTNFTNIIDLLKVNVGLSQIWTVFEKANPYILVVVLFSLGVWFLKHNIIEHSKGRDF